MSRPRILVASLTDHAIDGRIARQIRLLATHHRLIASGTGPSNGGEMEFVQLEPPGFDKSFWHRLTSLTMLATRCYESYYWSRPWVVSALQRLSDVSFDLILVNDLPLLPVAVRLADGRPVLFDAHEYYPRQHENEFLFRALISPYLSALCTRYLRRTEATFTVSPGLAAQYERQYGVRCDLIRSVPERQQLEPSPVAPERLRLVYHGVAQPRRRLDQVIHTIQELDPRFELHLVLKGKQRGIDELRRIAENSDRIIFHPEVPNRDLCHFINQFDLGLAFFPPTTFNLQYCLPNKFFEYIQARLGVVIGPSPDMAEIVEREGCGIITPDFTATSLAESLESLSTEDVWRLKQKSHQIAPQYCWEIESHTLLDAVHEALRQTGRSAVQTTRGFSSVERG